MQPLVSVRVLPEPAVLMAEIRLAAEHGTTEARAAGANAMPAAPVAVSRMADDAARARKRRKRPGCLPGWFPAAAVNAIEDTRPPQGLLPRARTRGFK